MSDSFESSSSRSRSPDSTVSSRSSRSGRPYQVAQQQPSPVTQKQQPNAARNDQQYQVVPPTHHVAATPYPIQVSREQVSATYDQPPPQQEPSDVTRSRPTTASRPTVPPEGAVVRVIRPEDFKALFHGSILQDSRNVSVYQNHPHDRSISPRRHVEFDTRAAQPSLHGARPPSSSRSHDKSRKRSGKEADFIDPYRGTTYRHKITVPTDESKQLDARRKQRTASRLRAQVLEAQSITATSAIPPKGPSYKEMGAYQELLEAKQALLKKDKELDGMRHNLRHLQEQKIRLENSTIKGKSADTAAALQATLDGLRGKVHSQARQIQELEDDLYDIKQRSRACRVGELEHQCAAYIAENRRLASVVSDMNEITKRGGEAALLQEAQTLLRHKDGLVDATNEKMRVALDDLRRAEAEAQTWRSRWEHDHKETEEVRRRLEEVREAPAEVIRLRRQLQSIQNDQVENTHREERHKAGAVYEQSHAKHHLEIVTRERDELLSRLQEKEDVLTRYRTEASKRAAAVEQDTQAQIALKVKEERSQFQERETQLKYLIGDWERKYRTLEETNVRLQEKHQKAHQQQVLKEQQTQDNIVATMGKFDNDRMADLHRDLEARERRLRVQQDELALERARWDEGQQQRHIQRQASPPPLSAPLYPTMSTTGPSVRDSAASPRGFGDESSFIKSTPAPNTMSTQRLQDTGSAAVDAQRKSTATRYERGDDAPSEVTVRHLRDDRSSLASSIQSVDPPTDSIVTPPPKNAPLPVPNLIAPTSPSLRGGSFSGTSAVAAFSQSAPKIPVVVAVPNSGSPPVPAAPPAKTVVAVPVVTPVVAPVATVVPAPAPSTAPLPNPPVAVAVPVVVPTPVVPKVPHAVPVPVPAAVPAPAATQPKLPVPVPAPVPAPVIPSKLPVPVPAPVPAPVVATVPVPVPTPTPKVAPVPVVVPTPSAAVKVPMPAPVPAPVPVPTPSVPVVTPVIVPAVVPVPVKAANVPLAAPPAVNVVPITGMSTGAQTPSVPAPVAVAVGVPMTKPAAVPVPTPIGAPVPPPVAPSAPPPAAKPLVGAVAPTAKKAPPKVTSDDSDSDDEEFVVNSPQQRDDEFQIDDDKDDF